MDFKKKVSIAVVRRLPRYYRYLSDLHAMGIARVSSSELSGRMGITASQIRQDLNCFGGFGQQGYGYNVELLTKEIGSIIGVDENFKTIIIGAGHMGKALSNYHNFGKRGFSLVGIFDVSPNIIGTKIKDIVIQDFNTIDEFVKEQHVDIAILTLPYDHTRAAAMKVASLGIKGLWNFSPMDLQIPYDVIIENVHLSDSLMVLGYGLNEYRNNQ